VVLAEHFGSIESFSFSTPGFAALKENDTVTGLSAFRPWRFRTTIHGESQLTNSQLVSGGYFPLLGVRAHLGRTLTEQDNQAANPVAVLSFRYWEREFNSDAGVIGRGSDQFLE
jgi:putative ABC transport system permease protein